MESGNAVIHGGLEKTKNALLTWGVPAVGVLTGIILGDAAGLGGFLDSMLPIKLGPKTMGVIVAAGYAVAGALIWSHFGIIGRFIGALLFGCSIAEVYKAIAGKALIIPGLMGA